VGRFRGFSDQGSPLVVLVQPRVQPPGRDEAGRTGMMSGFNGCRIPALAALPLPGRTSSFHKGPRFTSPGTAWVCIRSTESAPTPVMGGFVATWAFVGFVPAGSAGYRAEPTAAPMPSGAPRPAGGLPNTSTAPADAPLAQLALGLLALVVLGAAFFRRRLRSAR
jgi:MYXO-CTERM domain-containing protein